MTESIENNILKHPSSFFSNKNKHLKYLVKKIFEFSKKMQRKQTIFK